MDVSFTAWDTMTLCASRGIVIEHYPDDVATLFQVHAREPKGEVLSA